jgi:hypothetical protein
VSKERAQKRTKHTKKNSISMPRRFSKVPVGTKGAKEMEKFFLQHTKGLFLGEKEHDPQITEVRRE